MQKILDDDFDSYSDGDLNGQGNWLGDTDFDVQGVIKYSGTKAVKCSLGGTITNIVNPIKNGEVSCYMKIVDSGSGYKYGRLNLYEGSTLIMYLMLNEPYGYLKLITTKIVWQILQLMKINIKQLDMIQNITQIFFIE